MPVADDRDAVDVKECARDVGPSTESSDFQSILVFDLAKALLEVIIVKVSCLVHGNQLDLGASLSPRQRVRIMLKYRHKNDGDVLIDISLFLCFQVSSVEFSLRVTLVRA